MKRAKNIFAKNSAQQTFFIAKFVIDTIKTRVHLKAILTSLSVAFLPISRSRFKQRHIPPLNINQCFAVFL